jgi:hypothetical protein
MGSPSGPSALTSYAHPSGSPCRRGEPTNTQDFAAHPPNGRHFPTPKLVTFFHPPFRQHRTWTPGLPPTLRANLRCERLPVPSPF